MSRKVRYLVIKGNSRSFRMRVPADLVEHVGKTEVSETFRDLTAAQEAVRCHELGAQYKAHFLDEQHRLGLAANPPAPVARAALPKREATAEEVEALAKVEARELMQIDEAVRIDGNRIGDEGSDPWGDQLDDLERTVRGMLADGTIGSLKSEVLAKLAPRGLTLPEGRTEVRTLLRKWAATMAPAFDGIDERAKGIPIETPPPVVLPASLEVNPGPPLGPDKKPARALKLRDVYELWRTDVRNRRAKTVQVAALAVTQFEALTGNPSLGLLTKGMGNEFRRALLSSKKANGEPMGDKTAKNRLTWVQTLLNFEVSRYERIAANPWKGLTIVVKKTANRQVWQDADACTLFSLPLFQKYELPADGNAGGAAGYWVPILGAYTGARITELAQLLVADIRREGAQWFIVFAETYEWQKLKGDAAWRTIPMHTELVRLGLPEYAQAMHGAGSVRMFPDAEVSKLNNAGGGVSKWFSALKTAEGFGRGNTFHGWRNTIETKLHRAREGQVQIDKYVGHAPRGGEGPETYARLEPSDLIETAAKISYEGLQLPRVYQAQRI